MIGIGLLLTLIALVLIIIISVQYTEIWFKSKSEGKVQLCVFKDRDEYFESIIQDLNTKYEGGEAKFSTKDPEHK